MINPERKIDTLYVSIEDSFRLRFTTADNAYAESAGTPHKVGSGKLRVAVNREYLLRCFRLGLNHVRIIDALSPLVFADGPGSASRPARRRAIVMPMRVV